jgi:hypothetical protein
VRYSEVDGRMVRVNLVFIRGQCRTSDGDYSQQQSQNLAHTVEVLLFSDCHGLYDLTIFRMHDIWIHGLELTIFGLTDFELIIFELTVFEITVF